MRNAVEKYAGLALLLAASGWLSAQDTNPVSGRDRQDAPIPSAEQQTYDNTPLYHIQAVARDIPAINYMHKKDSTTVGFQGTSSLPETHGEAKVRAENGRTVIDANFDHLPPANTFGPEYLTYVLWAISPEGRPVNLGEVLPGGKSDKDHITVTTDLQAFGMIVTAEPYFAVTVPSDLVVAQNNVVEGKTNGIIEPVNAHYQLLPRGAYQETAGRKEVIHPIKTDEHSPLELYEAVNAVAIAEAGGANQYAADSMQKAREALKNAQDLDIHKGNRKETITYAREAVQAADDARLITIRKLREADEQEARDARVRAEQARAQAEQAAAEQAQQRAQAEHAAQQAQQQADAAQREQQQAQQAAAQAREEQQRAEQQTATARQAQQQAEQSAQQMAQQAEQARERLREQLSQVLQTQETARGLIMNLSDVLFGFNKYELKPNAREKLAKISGILLAYPDLKVQVEGYTDNVGSADYNQKLSEERADNVKNFLVSQNVSSNNVTAEGLGETNPVADNESNSGRAQNRRVELVVSGAAIGIQSGAVTNEPGTALPTAQSGEKGTSSSENAGPK